MILPNDLKEYCKRKVLSRVIPCLVWVLLFAGILILWGDVIFGVDRIALRISICVIVMILPFLLTGIPFLIFDRTYYGRVKRVLVETTVDNESSVKPTLEHLYWKNTIHLEMELPNGKTVLKKVYSGNAKLQQRLNDYAEGDKVFHLYGSRQVIRLPKQNDTMVDCAVCACSNSIEQSRCRNCGHSLIKEL